MSPSCLSIFGLNFFFVLKRLLSISLIGTLNLSLTRNRWSPGRLLFRALPLFHKTQDKIVSITYAWRKKQKQLQIKTNLNKMQFLWIVRWHKRKPFNCVVYCSLISRKNCHSVFCPHPNIMALPLLLKIYLFVFLILQALKYVWLNVQFLILFVYFDSNAFCFWSKCFMYLFQVSILLTIDRNKKKQKQK